MERYKLRDFAKWAKKEGISDDELAVVVSEMSRGLLGDRLGHISTRSALKLRGEAREAERGRSCCIRIRT